MACRIDCQLARHIVCRLSILHPGGEPVQSVREPLPAARRAARGGVQDSSSSFNFDPGSFFNITTPTTSRYSQERSENPRPNEYWAN